MLIDTHCHFAHGKLYQRFDQLLDEADQQGVTTIIAAASDLQESKVAHDLAKSDSRVFCLAGVHPHEAKEVNDEMLQQIRDLLAFERCVALGEIGLDYHYDFSPRPIQKDVFAAQLDMASELGCPVVIHTREAFADTMEILRASKIDGQRVVFHSFTGGPDQTKVVLDFGASISYSGLATFKTAPEIRESVKMTPVDRIMVETDAPFLSPVPVRKIHPNVPAHVAHVARYLADHLGQPFEEFARQTTQNAIRFFGLPVEIDE